MKKIHVRKALTFIEDTKQVVLAKIYPIEYLNLSDMKKLDTYKNFLSKF